MGTNLELEGQNLTPLRHLVGQAKAWGHLSAVHPKGKCQYRGLSTPALQAFGRDDKGFGCAAFGGV